MKNDRLHYLEKAVDYVADRTSYFGIDEVRMAAECKGLKEPPTSSDWSRLLRGCVAKDKIKMTDNYRRSNLKEANGIARMLYKKMKKNGGDLVEESIN